MGDITKETYDRIKEDENVSHPSHYTWLKDKCGIEVIDIIRHLPFNKVFFPNFLTLPKLLTSTKLL